TGNNANSNNYYGTRLYSSSYNTVTGNNANSNNNIGISLDSSSNNTVTGNNANSNNDYGILLDSSSNNNTVTGNNASNNYYGIYLESSSNNNLLYHNNLIDNTQNAYDVNTNYWDNNYPSGGNYWDDYSGIDSDGDGIGDTPYSIPGGDNEDRYPFMNPNGWPNRPPDTPTITGETNGQIGVEYEYTFNAVDPDGDNVKYYIDWDDGDSEETGFNPSGTDVKVKHTWNNEGTYTITAYAEDTNGLIGPEGTLSVSMPRNRATQTPFLQFLQN
ncbi:unnamed protein product, partial [marine sediment metagenome]